MATDQKARSSNLLQRAKRQVERLVFFVFRKLKKEIQTGQIRSIKNSPVDCFVVRVRADERRSEAGESLTARKTKSKDLSFFVKKNRKFPYGFLFSKYFYPDFIC